MDYEGEEQTHMWTPWNRDTIPCLLQELHMNLYCPFQIWGQPDFWVNLQRLTSANLAAEASATLHEGPPGGIPVPGQVNACSPECGVREATVSRTPWNSASWSCVHFVDVTASASGPLKLL
ncbi:hypothetical protein P7K49_026140 [Saguinus oedipus]|uniref:Uncharacterized protein n=1 Tax=Saguinus oedipus TaxID=9490 RepID=A0ABQ9UJ65_SAGOE|nr:hypothetical protein P7K49_026140 [Saguinus oedipus]